MRKHTQLQVDYYAQLAHASSVYRGLLYLCTFSVSG